MFDLMPFEHKTRNIANFLIRSKKHSLTISRLVEIRTDILDKGDWYVLQAELPGF